MGERYEETKLPGAFAITEERLEKLKDMSTQAPTIAPRVEKSIDITLNELQEPVAEIRMPSLTTEPKQQRVAATA
jgi:hypothetical protein